MDRDVPQVRHPEGACLEGAAAPIPRSFEDFAVGMRIDLGTWRISAEEIIEFAREFDPQPMHLDPVAGAASLLGGLAASGWHSCCILTRMVDDCFLRNSSVQAGAGINRTRWRRPVLAGDTLDGQTEILHTRVSRTRPELGLVTMIHRLFNQRKELAVEFDGLTMFTRRAGSL